MKLPLHLPSPPRLLLAALLLGGVGSLVPLTLFLMHSTSYHKEPRIHLFQDMDNQVKYKAQAASPLFADGRAMRPAVPGAVGRGHVATDDHRVRGFELVQTGNAVTEPGQRGAGGDPSPEGAGLADTGSDPSVQDGPEPETDPSAATETHYFAGFPEGVVVDELFVKRGQERYEAMCSLCHGLDGRGNGPVHQRAQQLMTSGRGLGTAWVQPASLLKVQDGGLAYGRGAYPEGELFNTIGLGKGNMTGYGHAIPVDDRWAIVAYIRALQDAQEDDVLAEAAAADRQRAAAEAAGLDPAVEAKKKDPIPDAIANPPEADVNAGKGKDAVPGIGADSSTDASASDNAEEDAKAPGGPTEALGSD